MVSGPGGPGAEQGPRPLRRVGGHAVALHGAVRGTMDIDLVLRLDEKQFVAAERALALIGLTPRLPFVDIVLTHDLSELETRTFRIQGRQVRVVGHDDLIAMKSASGRPQDREDIRALKALGESS